MDELGAALSQIAEFFHRQRVDASAASLSPLEDRHPFSRASELARGHQARSTRADDQEVRHPSPCL
jgi:hypothetical protein